MLNEQNLCDLVIHKGEDWLCDTCSRYPRHVEEFEGLREWSLSLSCPVAAKMMLTREEPLTFLTEEDDEPDPLEEDFEDFDLLLFTQLEDGRNILFNIVQNRSLLMEQRKELVLDLAGQMQTCLDEGRLYDMDELLEHYAKDAILVEASGDFDGLARFERLKTEFSYLEQLEHLREDWSQVLEEAKATLYANGYEHYEHIYNAFNKEFGSGGDRQREWELVQEQLLIFFLYTYFCGAVYDDWIYSKAALSVFCVNFIQEFVMCRWFLADKHIDMEDYVELSYRFAREVEHSDDNLNLLEESMNSETA